MSDRFRLIVMSSDNKVTNETKIVTQLFENGLTHFHLRKPGWTELEMEDFLNNIPVAFHNRIVIHSEFHLTEKFKLKGIHLNEENRKNITAFENKKIISTSFHSLEDIENNKYPYEYVFLSPVFDSISKPGYTSKFDLETVKEHFKKWKLEKRIMPEVIALGGVEANNILAVKQLGFAGAAVLGVVWGSKDTLSGFEEVRSKIG